MSTMGGVGRRRKGKKGRRQGVRSKEVTWGPRDRQGLSQRCPFKVSVFDFAHRRLNSENNLTRPSKLHPRTAALVYERGDLCEGNEVVLRSRLPISRASLPDNGELTTSEIGSLSADRWE